MTTASDAGADGDAGAVRWTVVGVARPRSPWSAEAARWATSSRLAIDLIRCVGAAEAARRLDAGGVAALVAEAGAPGVDRRLVDAARRAGAAVLIVGEVGEVGGPARLAADAVLPATFGAADLHEVLVRHAPAPHGDATVRPMLPDADRGLAVDVATAMDDPADPADPDDPDDAPSWRGELIAVTGVAGCGTSTLAMALAQELAARPGGSGSVVLADLVAAGDLAMYHDVGDVAVGLQELVESHGRRQPGRAEVRRHLFAVETRDYALLAGLRRTRDRTAVGADALAATLDGLRATHRHVVVDVRHDVDGEAESGSADVESLHAAGRVALAAADAVVVCGDPTLRGVHGLVRAHHDVRRAGVDAARIVRVVNRAPRSPRRRAELARALAELGGDTADPAAVGPAFVPERPGVEDTHAVVGRLPGALAAPILTALGVVLLGKPSRSMVTTTLAADTRH